MTLIAIVASLAACGDTVAARIDGPPDTLVINSTVWTASGIRVLDRRDDPLTGLAVTYAVAPDSILAVSSHGAVRCIEDGSGLLTASIGDLTRTFAVRCEVVRSFGPPTVLTLIAGGPRVPLVIEPYDKAGRLMPRARLHVTVSDTTVVALRDGMIFPLKPGHARVSATSNARFGGPVIWVKAPPTGDSLRAREPGASGAVPGR